MTQDACGPRPDAPGPAPTGPAKWPAWRMAAEAEWADLTETLQRSGAPPLVRHGPVATQGHEGYVERGRWGQTAVIIKWASRDTIAQHHAAMTRAAQTRLHPQRLLHTPHVLVMEAVRDPGLAVTQVTPALVRTVLAQLDRYAAAGPLPASSACVAHPPEPTAWITWRPQDAIAHWWDDPASPDASEARRPGPADLQRVHIRTRAHGDWVWIDPAVIAETRGWHLEPLLRDLTPEAIDAIAHDTPLQPADWADVYRRSLAHAAQRLLAEGPAHPATRRWQARLEGLQSLSARRSIARGPRADPPLAHRYRQPAASDPIPSARAPVQA